MKKFLLGLLLTLVGASAQTIISVTPSISPTSGAQSFPLIVTMTDSGYTTGPNPLDNTNIYYTTDGTTPTFDTSPTTGATYYISPTGSDLANGTSSSTPWLSPNHSVNCGDQIIAAAGSYSSSNFGSGKWGTVTCAAGNNVAWLKCATFDTCKITASSDAIEVSKSYWGVQGWETTTTGSNGACFRAGPGSVHHIVFANDVANICAGGGFTAYKSGTSTLDYIAYIGDVAYNASGGTGACYSGLNVYEPIALDTNPGTHIFIAGSFSYNNVDGCSGKTDGEGFNYDTFDLSQGGGTPYSQQCAMENNIAVNNGSSGFLQENNGYSTSTPGAPCYFRFNTSYGNLADNSESFPIGKGEMYFEAAHNEIATNNLLMTNRATGAGSDPIYAFAVANCNNTIVVNGNWLYSAAGNTTSNLNCSGFAYGTNNTGVSPAFASTTIPSAPSCGSTANVPACMATMIANFTPTATAAKSYGYQIPVTTVVADPYFPAWLCNTNLPPGLVSTPCTPTGGGPTGTTKLYTAPITLSAAGTVKAIGMYATPGFNFVPSAVATATYTGSGGVKTWYVAPTGLNSNACTATAPCADPAYAETTKANPGDTVFVEAGTYNYAGVQAAFSKAGTAGNPITIVCATANACTLVNTVTGNNAVVLLSAAYLNFTGFIVTNTGAGNNQGINVTASNISITQNTVHGIETDCTSTAGGIQVSSGSSNITIDSNLIYDISMPAGIPKCGSSITNTEGINLGSAGSSNTITNNIVYWTSGGWGIAVGPLTGNVACASNLVGNNLVFSTARGGLLVTCRTVIVQNNILVYNGTQTTSCGLMYDITADNPTSGYNDFYSNNGGNYCVGFTPSGSTAVRTHDINTTDPASNTTFINWQADGSGNYQEISGSPTIGTGVASSPTHDYIGAVRPNTSGSGWDMGAYSFEGVSVTSITITSAGNVSTLLVGSTNQLKATCNPGGVDCTSSITSWKSSIPGNATVSSGGLVTGVTSNVSDLSANIDDSLTGWTNCVIGNCANGGTPGGVNAPGSVHQTINNANPSLNGASMLLSLTTLGSATTQTNSLWSFAAPSGCDLCTKFSSSFAVWPGAGSNALGYNMYDYDVTDNVEVMFGGQCNLTLGKWQISNATSGWVTTSASCSLSAGSFHAIQLAAHRVGTTEYFDTVTIDGVVNNLGQTLPVTTLPAGYTSAVGWQAQLNVGAQSGASTITENLDEVAFETGGPAPAFTATLGMVTSPAFPITITATTPIWSSAYLINASGSATMGIGSTNQYTAICVYSDSTSDSCNTADAHGVAVSTWTTATPLVASISATGLATGLSVGSTNFQAMLNNGNNSSIYTQNIANAATLQSITIAATGGQQTLAVGGTNQIIATCHYSDGTSHTCP